jgi:N-acetylmuramoyl-L-alanine amidase
MRLLDKKNSVLVSSLIVILLAFAVAQNIAPSKVLMVGTTKLKAIFPGGNNIAYTSAAEFATALGLDWSLTNDSVIFIQGGRTIRLTLIESASDASTYSKALEINGIKSKGQAAGRSVNTVIVPVKAVAEATGATVVDSGNQIDVLIDPAIVKGVGKETGLTSDRVAISVSRDVGFTSRIEGNVLVVYLRNTVGENNPWEVGGKYIDVLNINTVGNKVEVRTKLAPTVGYNVYGIAASEGVDGQPIPARVVIDVGTRYERVITALDRQPISVVLDPGHGAEDLGVSVDTLKEKDLSLRFAQLVGKLLTSKGISVKYTRANDSNPSLEERREMSLTSDVFLSFHASNLPGSTIGGVQIYHVGAVAPDGIVKGAREALEKETNPSDKRHLEAFVAPSNASGLLAEAISSNVMTNNDLFATVLSGQTQVVLERASKAANLIELGFLSDVKDRARLEDQVELKKLALTVMRGVMAYLAPQLAKIKKPIKPTGNK